MIRNTKINLLLAVLVGTSSGMQLVASDSGWVKAARIVTLSASAGALYVGALPIVTSVENRLRSGTGSSRTPMNNFCKGFLVGGVAGGLMAGIAAGSQLSVSDVCKPLVYGLATAFVISKAAGSLQYTRAYYDTHLGDAYLKNHYIVNGIKDKDRSYRREDPSNEGLKLLSAKIANGYTSMQYGGVGLLGATALAASWTGYQRWARG